MSKMGMIPQESGELKDFGGRQMSDQSDVMAEGEMGGKPHKGPYIHGHEEDKKGRGWHGAKKR